jgi:hypothetical protein
MYFFIQTGFLSVKRNFMPLKCTPKQALKPLDVMEARAQILKFENLIF